MKGKRYPLAGTLQQKTQSQLAGNPHHVYSDGGLEGSFGDPDDAQALADELRKSGARNVRVEKKTRHEESQRGRQRQNPGRVVLREPWTDGAEIVIEDHTHGYSGWLVSSKGNRLPISFGQRAPTNAREAMELAKKFLRGVHGRTNPHDEDGEDSDILEGMARCIWVMSWASWYEELSKPERRALRLPASLSGRTIDDVAPATPESAYEAARDLYLLIDRANGKTCGELFQRACEVDGCEWNAENAELFGHYLAMQSMGEGVSWFDDHKEFPLRMSSRGFEAHYDEGTVWWSPQVRSRQNPSHGWNLGDPLVLGTYAPGSRVQLADYSAGERRPSDWVRIVGNYATTTGVVVVKNERNNATHEKDGRSPLYAVDKSRSEKMN